MTNSRCKVPAEQLRRCCGPAGMQFQTTAEVPEFNGVIGQERALRSLAFGLNVQGPGYHLFVAGPTGTGRTSTARVLVRRKAAQRPAPSDWCYVYNFDEPDRPVALELPTGQGPEFARDVMEMVRELEARVPRAFASPEYEQSKARILAEARARIQQLLARAEAAAASQGFSLSLQQGEGGNAGFMLTPVPNPGMEQPAAPIGPRPAESADLDARAADAQAQVGLIMRQVWELERAARDHLRQLDHRLGQFTVEPVIQTLQQKYAALPKVVAWLERVEREVVEYIQAFAGSDPRGAYPLSRFVVNVLVSHRNGGGAPVVEETHPTWANLFGKVEPGPGGQIQDLNAVKAGALHRANGGYLILQAEEVLKHPPTWDALKRSLQGHAVRIEPPPDPRQMIVGGAGMAIRPEPVPLDVKVILVGGRQAYQYLYMMDETFRKLFKIKVEFDDRMDWTAENQETYISLIASFQRERGLLPLTRAAVGKVLEHSARLAEDQAKLSTEFHEVLELLYEANAWAVADGQPMTTAEHVARAIREKRLRSSLQEDRLQEMIHRGHLLVDVDGRKVGQVNGLTVLNVGDHAFGMPSRVTARVAMGRRGIVQIEREAEMSGKIHTKGVLSLSGYLGGKYARDFPLSLTASLAFEQIYTGVDGDSASSTELYALLSELAGLPIDQSIAVTGSVNQFGEIQPVGGVMYKIEGWYRACKERGLTGRQGVIIPHQNVTNVQLDDELVEAVQAGRFHVWAIRTVDEGIEILTGVPAGTEGPDGEFPPDSVHGRVKARLRELAERLAAFDGGE